VTLGFGTMCGVPMGTGAGDVDPAAVLHMIDSVGMSTSGNVRARLAMKVFAHGCRRQIAALAAGRGGTLDALVLTAGIGEHSSETRRLVCAGLEVLRIQLDESRNSSRGERALIPGASQQTGELPAS